MKRKELTFTHDKDTKGTHRYAEDAKEGEHVIGNLYIRKDKMDGERPNKLKVVVTEAKS